MKILSIWCVMYKIFFVEDDPVICRTVAEHLTLWGYEVQTVRDFSQVAEEFQSFSPHLVLLDIGLPGFNGFHWVRELRKHSKAPVVFLSSAADNINIVTAIELGGDDFIPKPFDLTVLTAKIQAVLRRAYTLQGSIDLLESGGAVLDISSETVTGPNGKAGLTKTEFRILKVLMENAGHTVSRGDLMARLWESENFIDDNTLSVNISRLRRKLEGIGVENRPVTRKGLGYLWE